jgi:hypothetical protein
MYADPLNGDAILSSIDSSKSEYVWPMVDPNMGLVFFGWFVEVRVSESEGVLTVVGVVENVVAGI